MAGQRRGRLHLVEHRVHRAAEPIGIGEGRHPLLDRDSARAAQMAEPVVAVDKRVAAPSVTTARRGRGLMPPSRSRFTYWRSRNTPWVS